MKKTLNSIVDLINNAMAAAAAMKHDPVRGHRPGDSKKGKSCFIQEEPLATLLEVIAGGAPVSFVKKDGVCFVEVRFAEPVGYTTTCQPVDGEIYTIRRVHGSLQAVGYTYPTQEDTTIATAVITEEAPDLWVLASLFPGVAEPQPDISGLLEGARITAEELRARGFVRVVRAE